MQYQWPAYWPNCFNHTGGEFLIRSQNNTSPRSDTRQGRFLRPINVGSGLAQREKLPPRRLLLVKPSSLGDVVNTLPALVALHRSWPTTLVDWLVKSEWAELLRDHPMLHEVVLLPKSWQQWPRFIGELNRRPYDMVIDFQGLLRSGLLSLMTRAGVRVGFADGREGSPWCYTHRVAACERGVHAVERYLRLIEASGVAIDGPRAFLLPRWRAAEAWVENFWRSEKIAPHETICVIHPAARWKNKRWPAERYAQLADWMLDRQVCRVVLIGGATQVKQIDEVKRQMRRAPIDLSGGTNLQQLTALLRRATLLVTNDSGPMHLSAAVNTPVVAVFGPTNPRETGPYGSGHIVIEAEIDCSGCTRRSCRKGLACLKAVSVEEVSDAVESQLRRKESRPPFDQAQGERELGK